MQKNPERERETKRERQRERDRDGRKERDSRKKKWKERRKRERERKVYFKASIKTSQVFISNCVGTRGNKTKTTAEGIKLGTP